MKWCLTEDNCVERIVPEGEDCIGTIVGVELEVCCAMKAGVDWMVYLSVVWLGIGVTSISRSLFGGTSCCCLAARSLLWTCEAATASFCSRFTSNGLDMATFAFTLLGALLPAVPTTLLAMTVLAAAVVPCDEGYGGGGCVKWCPEPCDAVVLFWLSRLWMACAACVMLAKGNGPL